MISRKYWIDGVLGLLGSKGSKKKAALLSVIISINSCLEDTKRQAIEKGAFIYEVISLVLIKILQLIKYFHSKKNPVL